jgi:hypothetical protein
MARCDDAGVVVVRGMRVANEWREEVVEKREKGRVVVAVVADVMLAASWCWGLRHPSKWG